MFKFKMVNNDKCKRCNEVENYKHLIWECREARKIWQLYNEYATSVNQQGEVIEYDNVYKIGNNANMNKVKIKIIQEMIQMERPTNWTIENINNIAKNINKLELYNRQHTKKIAK